MILTGLCYDLGRPRCLHFDSLPLGVHDLQLNLATKVSLHPISVLAYSCTQTWCAFGGAGSSLSTTRGFGPSQNLPKLLLKVSASSFWNNPKFSASLKLLKQQTCRGERLVLVCVGTHGAWTWAIRFTAGLQCEHQAYIAAACERDDVKKGITRHNLAFGQNTRLLVFPARPTQEQNIVHEIFRILRNNHLLAPRPET